MSEAISPALQLIVAGGLDPVHQSADEAKAKRMAIESKVTSQVYAELALMTGEKLRAAQHALIDAQHGQGLKANGSADEISLRVDILRNLRDLYQKKASSEISPLKKSTER